MYWELTLEVRQTVLFDEQAEFAADDVAVMEEVVIETKEAARETDEESVSLVLVIWYYSAMEAVSPDLVK